MNNLVDLMNATGTTPIELSKKTGIAISNVRRLMTLDDLSNVYKKTQKTIADVFGITVNQLVNGGTEMKNKILQTEIRKHAEALAVALRKYTDEPLYLRLTLFTRDVQVADDKEHVPDFCDLVCHVYDDMEETDPIVSQAYLIHHGEEGISKTTPFPYERTADNDSKD